MQQQQSCLRDNISCSYDSNSSSSSSGNKKQRRHIVMICYYEIRDSLMAAARALSSEYCSNTRIVASNTAANVASNTAANVASNTAANVASNTAANVASSKTEEETMTDKEIDRGVEEKEGVITFSHYPLLQARQEFADDEEDILKNFQGELATRIIPEDLLVEDEAVVVLLWWYIGGVSAKLIHRMMEAADAASVRGRCVHMLYNWDDPYVWSDASNEMEAKAALFDVALVSCQESCSWYVNAGTRMAAVYCLPGFDPTALPPPLQHGKDEEHKKEEGGGGVDVCICCTNLYENKSIFPDQLSPTRVQIVEAFAAQKEITFRIYGPTAAFAERYPENYGGELHYADTYAAFSKSKLNICTHVVGTRMGYLSERVSLVLGSGGLLWMDRVPQALLTEDHVTFIETCDRRKTTRSNDASGAAVLKEDSVLENEETQKKVEEEERSDARIVVEQAKRLLSPENAAALESKRKRGRALAMQRLTWFSWARRVKKYIEFAVSRAFSTSDTPPATAAAAVVDISLPDALTITDQMLARASDPIRISERKKKNTKCLDLMQVRTITTPVLGHDVMFQSKNNNLSLLSSNDPHVLLSQSVFKTQSATAAKVSYCMESIRTSRHTSLVPRLLQLSQANTTASSTFCKND